MKTIILFFSLTLIAAFDVHERLAAQTRDEPWYVERSSDPFWDPNCPTMDGYTLWMLRQKLTVRSHQTLVESEIDPDQRELTKIQFTNYLHLIDGGEFNSMIGTRYNKYEIRANGTEGPSKSIQHVWLWTAWQYRHARWIYSFTTENYFKGDERTLYEKTGNQFFSLLYVGYEFNARWNLVVIGGYDTQQMEGISKGKPIIGLQLRYQPSNRCKVLIGAPTLIAAEWTVLPATDFGMKYMITRESQVFVRQRLTQDVGISLQYKSGSNKSIGTYFHADVYSPDRGPGIFFNNCSQIQQQVSVNLGVNLSRNLGMEVGIGYKLKGNMSLYLNDVRVADGLKSANGYFLTCSLQHLN